MLTVRTVTELRDLVRNRRAKGGIIGLVPTMGALHEGHESLILASSKRATCTVVSVFVNPRQFGDASDLAAYPRTEERDAARAAAAGADVLFVPDVSEVYPEGFGTEVRVTGPLTGRLEGAHRGAEHFDGVTTVVLKLLNMVAPDVAFFGAKDYQQALVVRRMVADLNLPVEIATRPTVREQDGLALSSRNVRLSAEERRQAVAIPRAIARVVEAFDAGERDAEVLTGRAVAELEDAGLQPEYVAIADPADLSPVTTVVSQVVLALAVPVGPVRLIDNTTLTPVHSDSPVPTLTGSGRAGGFVPHPSEKG